MEEDVSNITTKELVRTTLEDNRHLRMQVTTLQQQLGEQLDELRAEKKANTELREKLLAHAGAVRAHVELEVDRIEKRLSKIAYGGPSPATRSLEDCYGRLEQMARFWFDNHKMIKKEVTP